MKKLLLCGVIGFCTTLHAENLISANDIYKLSDPSDPAYSRINQNSNRSVRELGQNNVVPTKEDLFQMEIKKREIEKKDSLCKAVFEMAENIMKARRAGISKTMQLQSNQQTPYRSPEYTKYEMYLINKAYDKSSYEKTLGTFEASKEFAYKSFFECKKSISSLIP
ncbi:hypothetical protein NRA69_14745 [Acinetobacter baumannii]|nr:hypothetical protein [Acinetobacter baumannii]MDC5271545.1 hypothetical protein [Acinetobacter baumannii]MDC5365344.1 hypothetical protein [Acinetobacter baumannii]MDC5564933.1 hypothetical protein [Acinetobacter baumannii]MDC5618754.1 hypothetical protein [Acinetobacter baumannii]